MQRAQVLGATFASLALALLFAPTPNATAGSSGTVSELVLTTNWAEHTVSLVNLASSEEKARINVGAKPYDIKVDSVGRFAYATLSGGSEISIIDIQANLEYGRIEVGEGPRDLILTSDDRLAVTANAGSNTISVVDLSQQKELHQIPVGMIPYGISLTDDEKLAIVSNWGEGTASIVDLAQRKEIARVPVGTLPYTVAIPKGNDLALITTFGDNKVAFLDIKKQEVVKKVDTDRSPWGLAVSPNGRFAAVANFYTGGITVLSMNDNALLAASEDLRVAAFHPNPQQADRAGVIRSKATGEEPLTETDTDPRVPSEDAPSSIRSKNVAISNEGTVVFSDLANNAIGTLDVNSGEFGKFISVGQAPYGLAFIEHGRQTMLMK